MQSNEDFAGAVVSLLDEVAQVSSHGSDWDESFGITPRLVI
jgi:hypothetical protein